MRAHTSIAAVCRVPPSSIPSLNINSSIATRRYRPGHSFLQVGGSTICTILVKYAEKNNLSIVVPDDDQLEGLVGPGVRQPRPLSKGDPMDALLGMDQHSAAEQWNLANGGTKRRDGKGRCDSCVRGKTRGSLGGV
jgi:hypothetical protein